MNISIPNSVIQNPFPIIPLPLLHNVISPETYEEAMLDPMAYHWFNAIQI
jgi:hypothetical protein